jgi:hypothetical protein
MRKAKMMKTKVDYSNGNKPKVEVGNKMRVKNIPKKSDSQEKIE